MTRDVDVLYDYAMLGAEAGAYGLKLSASRTHIILRDFRNQQVISEETIAKVRERLKYEVDNGWHEHSIIRPEINP